MINFIHSYFSLIKSSKSISSGSIIVIIIMSILSIFGSKIHNDPLINVIYWQLLGIVPTLIIAPSRFYLVKKDKLNLLNLFLIYSLGLLSVIIMLSIMVNISFEKIIDAVIIYILVVIPSEFITRNILNIEKDKYDEIITPNILYNIPLPERGDLWGLVAEDHYVNIITSKGEHLHYSTFKKAINDCKGVEGIQINRSFWIAKDGLKSIIKKDGKVICILKNKTEMTASKSGLNLMKKHKWIK